MDTVDVTTLHFTTSVEFFHVLKKNADARKSGIKVLMMFGEPLKIAKTRIHLKPISGLRGLQSPRKTRNRHLLPAFQKKEKPSLNGNAVFSWNGDENSTNRVQGITSPVGQDENPFLLNDISTNLRPKNRTVVSENRLGNPISGQLKLHGNKQTPNAS